MQNFNIKNTKDIELASETTIPNLILSYNIIKNTPIKPISNATTHQFVEESFETFLEKKI